MSSFCTAKATHIFFSKKFKNIHVSLYVNFNESLTNDVVSFEQLGPEIFATSNEYSQQHLFLYENMLWYSIEFLSEALLMSTNNICLYAEIRKLVCSYSFLSRTMKYVHESKKKKKKSRLVQNQISLLWKPHMISYLLFL